MFLSSSLLVSHSVPERWCDATEGAYKWLHLSQSVVLGGSLIEVKSVL